MCWIPKGKQLLNRGCRNDWRQIADAVAPLGVVKRAAIEACCGAADLAEELVAHAGWHMDMAHPQYVARIKQSPDKSDYSDGRMLADLTRVGYLPRVWLAGAYERDLRQLVNHRQSLVDHRRALKLRVDAWCCASIGRSSGPKLSRLEPRGCFGAKTAPQLSEQARWIVNDLLEELEHLGQKGFGHRRTPLRRGRRRRSR